MAKVPQWMFPEHPPRLGVSACLLGRPVRWDGGHKRDGVVTGALTACCEMVPLCPELDVGLGVPRPPIRLSGTAASYRARGEEHPALDPTGLLEAYGRQVAGGAEDFHGLVLKSGSPSCGVAGVPVHGPSGGVRSRSGVGVFAGALMAVRPELPVADETALAKPEGLEHFVDRVAAFHRWSLLRAGEATPAALADFHQRHRLALLSRNAARENRLERCLRRATAGGGDGPVSEYGLAFMEAMGRPPGRTGHAAVLAAAADAVKTHLEPECWKLLQQAISGVRRGHISPEPSRLMLQSLLQSLPHGNAPPGLVGQTYFNPHPAQTLLRMAG